MTFSEDVRRELVGRQPSRECCRDALLSGLIRGAGSFQVRGHGELAVVLDLADPAAARLAFSIVRRRSADAEIVSFRERRLHRRNLVRLRIAGDRSLQLLHEVGVLSSTLAPLPTPPRRVVGKACCRGSFLRGWFVAAGSVAAPRRPAHLELRAPDEDAAGVLCAIAAEDGFELRTVPRRAHAIAYTKRWETVRDLLVHLGAQDAALSVDEADVVARTLERANRLTNCDRANLERSSTAAHRQREAIARLDLERLPPPLREVADLRLAHPSSSLTELARAAEPPLSKSTVARRMRALLALEP
jgi:cell division protein WhiA